MRSLVLLFALLALASADTSSRPALQKLRPTTPSTQLYAKKAPSTGAGMVSTSFNIINNVAGAGILTLSAGMAAGVGWVPAALICVVLGAISGYSFFIIGDACERTGEASFKGLWSRTLGAGSAWVVDACIALMCLSAAIIYSGILGDVSTSLLTLAGAPAALVRRPTNILAITACLLLPLSLLKDLSKLAFTSLLGCAAVLYTVTFMAIRAFDGSYAPGGANYAKLPAALLPTFEKASR